MSRLIEADEAKKNVCKWECGGEPDCPLNKPDVYTHEKCNSMRAIDECRTIDAVPVVRCKDCKHSWYDELFGMRWCNGKRHRAVKDDWFCADGEKEKV